MPQGDKSSYTDKQKRQAAHIEAGYAKKGVSSKTAEARAWATVNKRCGGGKKKRLRQEEPRIEKTPTYDHRIEDPAVDQTGSK